MATISKLSSTEQLNGGFTHRIKLTHADLTAAGTTQEVALMTLSVGQFVQKAGYALTTDFASANGTNVTMSIGVNGALTAYTAAKELQSTEVDYWFSDVATPPASAATKGTETEALIANFITGGGSSPLLSEYTAGEVSILLQIIDMTKLA